MTLLQVLILAIVQGAAELLPVSSSAHVILAEKLMGLDPTAPAMTMLLVMLHTGTMFAVIVHFWKSWQRAYFSSRQVFLRTCGYVVLATALTGVIGLLLQAIIKHTIMGNAPGFEIENLFGNPRLIASALAAAGILIIFSSRLQQTEQRDISWRSAAWIGAVQGLCLPFRGFSRSGATISTGLVLDVARSKAEEFSFALAVALTPAVIVREAYRLYKAEAGHSSQLLASLGPNLLGMVLSFGAGLLALRWLSSWLEHGRWHLFGAYCLIFAGVVLAVG